MIAHPVSQLVGAGVHEIMLTSSPADIGAFGRLLGSGRESGCSMTYRVQDQAAGISDALGLARSFTAGGKLVVILGDNIFGESIARHIDDFLAQKEGARVLLKEVPDPERFGVAEIDGGRIARIIEKPNLPLTNLAVVGVYMYDARVFDYLDQLSPSARGELEITDLNNLYARDRLLQFGIVDGWWVDAGTFESLAEANRLMEGSCTCS